jgi:hypothetical protein
MEGDRDYLFEEHSPQELRAWARRLARFRFCRAFGGPVGDADRVQLAVRAGSVEDALEIVAAVGAEPREHPVSPDLQRSEVAPGVLQPGWVRIDGETAFVWIERGRIEVSVNDPDDVWNVTEAAVRAAERIEPRFAPYDDRRIDPPLDTWHCIAPATHPELFGRE